MNEFNVIDRLCTSVKKAKTAIVLTHNIDFLFVESMLLPRLRDVGSPQLTIFADAASAANSYQSQASLVSKLGSRYRVVSVDLGAARRFHPKAFFLCGEEEAALAVGSGNITHGGWSANQEIWSDFLLPGDGGGEIAAFRDYLEQVLALIPDAERLRSNTVSAFSEIRNTWAQNLPEQSGLASTPNDTSMLDQILAFAGEGVEEISVLSPYFDKGGVALTRLASSASKIVTVRLQSGRAGLTNEIAENVPSNVRLQTIEAVSEEDRYKFIHAKTYVLKVGADYIVAAGSANCSQAALLATRDWGNAELMALAKVSEGEVNGLFERFSISDVPPNLPDIHPSEDWDLDSPEFRILTARKEGQELDVRFRVDRQITRLFLVQPAPDAPLIEAVSLKDGSAKFRVSGPLLSLSLQASCADGTTLISGPNWIDDEHSLRMATPERMLREKLDDAKARDSLTGAEYLKILELFDLHAQKPSNRGSRTTGQTEQAEETSIIFTEADIYSDEFAKPSSLFNPVTPTGFSDDDTMSLFLSFFQTRDETKARPTPRPRQSDEDQEGEDQKPDAVKAAEAKEDRLQMGAKIVRMLRKIQAAMVRPDFVQGRTPAGLAADIGFFSLLMTMARVDGNLGPKEYRDQTLAIWRALFFGPNGNNGIIPLRLAELDDIERVQFIQDMRSPRLTAAMTLWCMIDWSNEDLEAQRFRFASASLAAQYRWLSEGGQKEDILDQLQLIGSRLLPEEQREKLLALWADWVRDGHALERLHTSLSGSNQALLAAHCSRSQLQKGELTWHVDRGFCTLAENYNRSTATKAELHPIDQTPLLRVKINFVAPLIDILEADIGVSDNVKGQIFALAKAIAPFELG